MSAWLSSCPTLDYRTFVANDRTLFPEHSTGDGTFSVASILEPACGTGGFLVEALERRTTAFRVRGDVTVVASRGPGSEVRRADAQAAPAGYLDAFCYRMPAHGGFAIGLERWPARLTGAANIPQVTAFPRDINRLNP
jgi:hypothetical protein